MLLPNLIRPPNNHGGTSQSRPGIVGSDKTNLHMIHPIPQPTSIQRCIGKDALFDLAERKATQLTAEHAHNLPGLYVAVKRYETYLKALVRELQPTVVADARQRAVQTEHIDGSVFRLARYTRIDYSEDTRWRQLQGEISYLLDQRKAREQQLKERPVGTQEVDRLTGEVITLPSLPREIRYGLVVRL